MTLFLCLRNSNDISLLWSILSGRWGHLPWRQKVSEDSSANAQGILSPSKSWPFLCGTSSPTWSLSWVLSSSSLAMKVSKTFPKQNGGGKGEGCSEETHQARLKIFCSKAGFATGSGISASSWACCFQPGRSVIPPVIPVAFSTASYPVLTWFHFPSSCSDGACPGTAPLTKAVVIGNYQFVNSLAVPSWGQRHGSVSFSAGDSGLLTLHWISEPREIPACFTLLPRESSGLVQTSGCHCYELTSMRERQCLLSSITQMSFNEMCQMGTKIFCHSAEHFLYSWWPSRTWLTQHFSGRPPWPPRACAGTAGVVGLCLPTWEMKPSQFVGFHHRSRKRCSWEYE